MSKRMLIDATHEEETRVAIVDGSKLAEYDYESSSRKPIKGNIYLAKVTRVEPSLQAAFVNFGGNRHGFLPFSEIHPDYFRIPIADREALLAEQEALLAEQEALFAAQEAAYEQEAAAESDQAVDGAEQADQGSDFSQIEELDDPEEDYIEETGGAVASLDDSIDGENADVIPSDATEYQEAQADNQLTDVGDAEFSEDREEETQATGEEGENQPNADQRGRRDGRRGRGRRDGRRSNFRNRKTEIVGEEEMDGQERFRFNLRRKYKIQEVIKRGQIMLVQANKEERGNKGAAVGSYLSLPGRYCVLMPNSPRAGGVSRKIANYKDRARMREIMKELEVPKGMSVIVRTAGVARTKVEIKRDLDYLMRLWDSIRELTLQSTAPAMVYEEADLIKRSIRDLYTRDVEDIIVAGEAGFKNARNFMKMMVPSHIKKIQMYEENQIPLFTRYQIETQIQEIGMPTVRLKAGGYLVINPTEALVSIDVNSGKATKERHIEETALKTNLEAADEVARQLRLRDLGGLVVIDFIDMEDRRNNMKVERRLKDALSIDRARVQVGRISSFGLLELSRQRLSPSLTESQYETCSNCKGVGVIRTPEAMSIVVLRAIEEEGMRARAAQITVHVSNAVALYILNNKRKSVVELENRYGFEVVLLVDDDIPGSEYRLEVSKTIDGTELAPEQAIENTSAEASAEERETQRRGNNDRNRDRNRRGGRNRNGRDSNTRDENKQDRPPRQMSPDDAMNSDEDVIMDDEEESIGNTLEGAQQSAFRSEGHDPDRPKRNRNRRRGGRNRNRNDRTPREDGSSDDGASQNRGAPRNQDVQASNDDYSKPQRSQPSANVATSAPALVNETSPKAPQPKKEPQSSAAYEVVSEPVKEKKRGWWNKLVE